jgi:hypothetical protein
MSRKKGSETLIKIVFASGEYKLGEIISGKGRNGTEVRGTVTIWQQTATTNEVTF